VCQCGSDTGTLDGDWLKQADNCGYFCDNGVDDHWNPGSSAAGDFCECKDAARCEATAADYCCTTPDNAGDYCCAVPDHVGDV